MFLFPFCSFYLQATTWTILRSYFSCKNIMKMRSPRPLLSSSTHAKRCMGAAILFLNICTWPFFHDVKVTWGTWSTDIKNNNKLAFVFEFVRYLMMKRRYIAAFHFKAKWLASNSVLNIRMRSDWSMQYSLILSNVRNEVDTVPCMHFCVGILSTWWLFWSTLYRMFCCFQPLLRTSLSFCGKRIDSWFSPFSIITSGQYIYI